MKTIITFCFLFLLFTLRAQTNPVQNLMWTHWYDEYHNYFGLSWSEPEQPHDELLGYNIYRNDELFRFQEETYLQHFPDTQGGANVEESFLLYPAENPGPFEVHVTAVYESSYDETIWIEGMALKTEETGWKAFTTYPNPAKDFLHFSKPLKEISIYDLSGKLILTQKDSSEKLSNLFSC